MDAIQQRQRDILKDMRRRHGLDKDARVATRAPETLELSVRSKPGGRMIVEAVANTASVDNHRTVILPGGADTTYFDRYRTILYNHDDMMPPIGRMESCTYQRGKEQWFVRFSITGATTFAQDIGRLIEDKCINGVSIGFLTDSYGPPTDEERSRYGDYEATIRKWKWLELSVTPMPSNSDALIHGVQQRRISPQTAIDLGAPCDAFAWSRKAVNSPKFAWTKKNT